jgi:uncharacterized damage-inducible protein DinB
MANETAATSFKLITADDLLKHWQEHRRLTRKVIEAFPEDKLFTFSVGGMRTFGELACEFLGMVIPVVDGVATGKWNEFKFAKPTTKADLLRQWDEQTVMLNEKFPGIPEARFSEVDKAFGQWEMPGLTMIQYSIENEIHHRGQGYVYLRALGIEPPMFYDRS